MTLLLCTCINQKIIKQELGVSILAFYSLNKGSVDSSAGHGQQMSLLIHLISGVFLVFNMLRSVVVLNNVVVRGWPRQPKGSWFKTKPLQNDILKQDVNTIGV